MATDTSAQADVLRMLAQRTDPRNPAAPPWAWTNLSDDEIDCLEDALDLYVNDYNLTYGQELEDTIPSCWRFHDALAQEILVQFWGLWGINRDPAATITNAVDFYTRTLPAFQNRLARTLIGKDAINCRRGRHTGRH